MFIELVDALRCPVEHEETWLVAAADRMESRHIVEGRLGCPVCSAEYPIHDGVVDFRRGAAPPIPPFVAPEPELSLRVTALLDLTDGTGFVVLLGAWGNHAFDLANLVQVPMLLIDPSEGITGCPGISVLRSAGRLPLAANAARGMAVDGANAARADQAAQATRVGGRIIAPVDVVLPAGVRELARDETLWVGEREPIPSPPLALHVRRGQR